LPTPTHLKIDVDGLESLVIQGLENYIDKIHLILVEVDTKNIIEDSKISSILTSKGFLRIKEFSGYEFGDNQLWKNSRVSE